jgi:hypothetical protein
MISVGLLIAALDILSRPHHFRILFITGADGQPTTHQQCEFKTATRYLPQCSTLALARIGSGLRGSFIGSFSRIAQAKQRQARASGD